MQRCHTYKLQSQNIFKESTGGGRVGGVRVDVNEELMFLRILKKKKLGGGGGGSGGWGIGVGLGGQGGCERRIEVYVKIKNLKKYFLGGGRVVVGLGVGGGVFRGGGGWMGGSGWM